MKKLLCINMLLACAVLFFSGCSKKDQFASKPRKVVYKITGSEGTMINTVIYTNETGEVTTIPGHSGSSWTSEEITIPGFIREITVGAVGTGPQELSTLTAQILISGDVKSENTAVGKALNPEATYN